jgi:serine O-acetyltransferase
MVYYFDALAWDNTEMTEWDKLRADTWRLFGRFRLRDLLVGFMFIRTFRPVVTMRLCQMASHSRWCRIFLPVLKVAHRVATQLCGIDLKWCTDVGPGFAITHGWGLVVSPGVKIGANVTLFHGVTLGRRDHIGLERRRETRYPIIEDEVWIGPHAIVVGGVTIGRGSRIAGGAFVTESVTQHPVVVGNPAVVIDAFVD